MWLQGPISRDKLAVLLALVTVVCLGLAFVLSKGTPFLMPGPLASVHGAIENCNGCHTKSGSGKFSWTDGLIAGDPLADSKACLTCHKMPDTAFNAHGIPTEALKKSTERLTKIAAQTPAPASAGAQSLAFPTNDVVARGLFCATCHQEHQGVNFDLNKISNEQCRSCHVVKFDRFDGNHPQFDNYPFKRRTRIVYDHAGHFGKHYPEVAKKNPAKRIPDTCSTCHNSREDKRVMAVVPFEQTCTACHLDQIVGKERVSGPKGIAFLTLPGLDLDTLKQKNASIGEWPDASEAELAPFMKAMIGRDEPGRALVKTVEGLNLLDLSTASDDQIKAVTDLVWEIKGLYYKLISGKASDVLGDLNIGGGAKLSADLVADLTANIPRDVVTSAQQQWLPNLAKDMANRQDTSRQKQGGWKSVITKSRSAELGSPEERPGSRARQATPGPNPRATGRDRAPGWAGGRAAGPGGDFGRGGGGAAGPGGAFARGGGGAAGSGGASGGGRGGGAGPSRLGGPAPPDAMRAGVIDAGEGRPNEADTANAPPDEGKQRLAADESGGVIADESGGVIKGRWKLPGGTSRSIGSRKKDAETAAEPEDAGAKDEATKSEAPESEATNAETPSADEQPRTAEPAPQDAGTAGQPDGAAKEAEAPKSEATNSETPSADEPPRAAEPAPQDPGTAGQPDGAAKEADAANGQPDAGKETPPADTPPQAEATDQRDDLLFPTEAEVRGITEGPAGTEKSAPPEAAAATTDTANTKPDAAASAGAPSEAAAEAPAGTSASPAAPPATAAPVLNIESDVDPESWAEYGGWYRQDYAIYYRPTGHKDKFIYSWLYLTGPQAQKGDTSAAAAVFDYLTGKEAQGSCTKCHSVDELPGKGRVVNFSPRLVESKRERFTNFIHEPHFGILETRGCLTCHQLEKGRPYLKSYEQGNPQSLASNFGAVKKDLCKTCHASGLARQDCLLCHKYHVNEVITPIINTKIPTR